MRIFPTIAISRFLKRKPIIQPLVMVLLLGFIFGNARLNAQIAEVGGTLTESKTWSSDTTYLVYSDLIIPPSVTLTIPPGTKVIVNFGWGIFVNGGNLKIGSITGGPADTVSFRANWLTPGEYWRWKGISFRNVNDENLNFISHASIRNTEVAAVLINESSFVNIDNCNLSDTNTMGVMINNSSHVAIRNCDIKLNETAAVSIFESNNIFIYGCNISHNQNLGIDINNSHNCIVRASVVEDNEDGIRFEVSNMDMAFNNKVDSCIIKNENHNIYAKNSGSAFYNNVISDNLIEGGRNGIWFQNEDGLQNGTNSIVNNIIYYTGEEVGYGLFNMFDSTLLINNIFWANSSALVIGQNATDCILEANSFFQNDWGIAISGGATNNSFIHNTLSHNMVRSIDFKGADDLVWDHNNLVVDKEVNNAVFNHHLDDIDMGSNYWGTTNELRIDAIIWDVNDEPMVGMVDYQPFLPEVDTNSPILPPYHIKKQQIEGDILVSWDANYEPDLDGYSIHFGDFVNYGFETNLYVGKDTSFIIASLAFDEMIALTARDKEALSTERHPSSHLSPFSFAIPFPYAGPDTLVCTNQAVLDITFSTAPFIYKSLKWTTSGDGSFDDDNELHTQYFPGSEDFQQSDVVLSLSVIWNDIMLTDSFRLSILDGPQVYAGEDTTVFNDAIVNLHDAAAHFYDGVTWLSTGDGSFIVDTVLNTSYIPGPLDIEKGDVTLILNAYSDCGLTTDSMNVVLETFYTLEGRLWHHGQQVMPAVVLAIQNNIEHARAVALTQTDEEGLFKFEKMREGWYYIYAVPDTHNIYEAVPGYYADKLNWEDAYQMEVVADVYDVDIFLPGADVKLPQGEASISGHFVMPALQFVNTDLYCVPWFGDNSQNYCNGGLSNTTILLMDTDRERLLDYTLTDANGNFFFKGLPFGDYTIDAEKSGYTSSTSPDISLSPDHPDETGVLVEINQGKIGIYVEQAILDAPVIYPNPTLDYLYLDISMQSPHTLLLEIYNSLGQVVIKKQIPSDDLRVSSSLRIDVSEWPGGLFIGRLSSPQTAQEHRFSFIKR